MTQDNNKIKDNSQSLQMAVSKSVCKHEYECITDTDYWSINKCKKCGKTEILDFD